MTTSTRYLDCKTDAGQTLRRTARWFALVLLSVAQSLPALLAVLLVCAFGATPSLAAAGARPGERAPDPVVAPDGKTTQGPVDSLAAEDPLALIRAYARGQGRGVSAYDIASHFSAPGGTSITYGAEHVFNGATTFWISVAALDATHFVAGYTDIGNARRGTAIVGEVSGTTITSYGTEQVFNAARTREISVAALDATHFVAGYEDEGNSDHGTAIVGTVSGTTITSYGTEQVFNAASTSQISVAALDATHFVAGYEDVGNARRGTAIVGEVSGTTITSYGAEQVFNAARTFDISVAALDATHFVAGYEDGLSGPGTAIVGEVRTKLTVNTAADNTDPSDTFCTLREALTNANTNSDTTGGDCAASTAAVTDVIEFDIPGGGVQTIELRLALPAITEAVEIDGYSQPGASANTLSVGTDAVLLIELDGTGAGALVNGLEITGPGSTIKGLVINRFSFDGIRLSGAGATGNTIVGNFIGTDTTGTADLGNAIDGVGITSGASNNTIGGTAAEARNVISGNNQAGVRIEVSGTTGNTIAGNYIGTDATATADLGNSVDGVNINKAADNTIGGTVDEARNVISGNNQNGVVITGSGTTGNTIAGNYIGADAGGTLDVGNSQHGVLVASGASNNTIGGTVAEAGNVIAFNGLDGVWLTSQAGTGNAIEGNSMFENDDLGIDLGGDGVTPNDPGDGDGSPNNLQNFPELTSLTIDGAGDLLVTYHVDSDPVNAAYPLRVEFFEADDDDQEGQTYLGADSFTTSDHTAGSTTVNLSDAAALGVSLGDKLVATATDSGGNTSEFSGAGLVAPAGPATRYVATTGSDTANTCLVQASPCATVGHAIDQANAGDTIVLSDGAYPEPGLVIDKAVLIEATGAVIH